jgi:hypothetical protein
MADLDLALVLLDVAPFPLPELVSEAESATKR